MKIKHTMCVFQVSWGGFYKFNFTCFTHWWPFKAWPNPTVKAAHWIFYVFSNHTEPWSFTRCHAMTFCGQAGLCLCFPLLYARCSSLSWSSLATSTVSSHTLVLPGLFGLLGDLTSATSGTVMLFRRLWMMMVRTPLISDSTISLTWKQRLWQFIYIGDLELCLPPISICSFFFWV